MTDELKACPFCGSSDIRICTVPDDNPESESGEWITVGCYDCGTMAQLACLPGTKDESIEQWNTRPIEDALRAEIERLNKALDEIVEFPAYCEISAIDEVQTIARAARLGE